MAPEPRRTCPSRGENAILQAVLQVPERVLLQDADPPEDDFACAVFLFRHTSRLGGTWRGDVCHWVMAFVLALEKRRSDRMTVYKERCSSVADIFREALSLVKRDCACYPGNKVFYCFRGESHNYSHPGSEDVDEGPVLPSIYRGDKLIEHESDILNEALRTFPEYFKDDKTTFEILSRMRHYGYATRLLDVTPKLTTALAMALARFDEKKDWIDLPGFIHVYRIHIDKVKYSTGDTVTALCNLARIKSEHVKMDDLEYLAYECRNERAGFFWKKKGDRINDIHDVSAILDRDIGKVWYVKPVVNSPRINSQRGEFFLFGCGENKKMLDATFSEEDFNNDNAATDGISHIATLTLLQEAKKEAREM